jgi:competence protein ComEA
MVTVYRVKSDPHPPYPLSEDADDSSWQDIDDEPPRRSAPLRLSVTAVIGLAIVGVALTSAATVVRSLGTSDVVAEDVPEIVGQSDDIDTPPIVEAARSELIIHVVGQVNTPGIVTVDEGSRVVDAIEAAGGVTGEAELDRLNLARVVGDGEQIVVPARGEERAGDAPGMVSNGPGLISLSQADQSQLDSLPGIGPALATRIIAWRETHGPFSQVSDVLAVAGIGPSTLEQFAHLVIP